MLSCSFGGANHAVSSWKHCLFGKCRCETEKETSQKLPRKSTCVPIVKSHLLSFVHCHLIFGTFTFLLLPSNDRDKSSQCAPAMNFFHSHSNHSTKSVSNFFIVRVWSLDRDIRYYMKASRRNALPHALRSRMIKHMLFYP